MRHNLRSLRKYFFKQVLGKGDEGKNTMKWKYILKRILIAIPTFFRNYHIGLFYSEYGAWFTAGCTSGRSGNYPAELERKRVALGLDQPVIIQYFTWLKQLLTGNLGFSYSTQRPVAAMILERLPATAILAASSIVLSLIVSIPLGIFAASRPNSGKRLLFRRSVYADDGDSELLCRTGIYLSVRHCV